VWTPLATNTMPASTVWQFVDEDSVKFPYRFYRVQFRSQSVTPVAPYLTVTRSNNTVAVSWPSPATGWNLQQNTNSVSSVNWSNVTTTIHDDGTTKTLIVNPPTGNRFYRLRGP